MKLTVEFEFTAANQNAKDVPATKDELINWLRIRMPKDSLVLSGLRVFDYKVIYPNIPVDEDNDNDPNRVLHCNQCGNNHNTKDEWQKHLKGSGGYCEADAVWVSRDLVDETHSA